jgi:hypothetical protein
MMFAYSTSALPWNDACFSVASRVKLWCPQGRCPGDLSSRSTARFESRSRVGPRSGRNASEGRARADLQSPLPCAHRADKARHTEDRASRGRVLRLGTRTPHRLDSSHCRPVRVAPVARAQPLRPRREACGDDSPLSEMLFRSSPRQAKHAIGQIKGENTGTSDVNAETSEAVMKTSDVNAETSCAITETSDGSAPTSCPP